MPGSSLKVPKCEIFYRSYFHEFLHHNVAMWGDFGDKLNLLQNISWSNFQEDIFLVWAKKSFFVEILRPIVSANGDF
jgi:hypothetical protein